MQQHTGAENGYANVGPISVFLEEVSISKLSKIVILYEAQYRHMDKHALVYQFGRT